jgi:hypothetical protein
MNDSAIAYAGGIVLARSTHLVSKSGGSLAAAGLGEGAGVAAMGTVVPLVREFEGLTITLSDSVTPVRISDCAFWLRIHHDSERLERVGR